MTRDYPTIPRDEIDRQGETWLFCDAEDCDAAVHVDGITEHVFQQGRRTITELVAPMPDGWATSDPDGNPLNGAADFCPAHADRIFVPAGPAPDPIHDSA
jgi:hypothetical protein